MKTKGVRGRGTNEIVNRKEIRRWTKSAAADDRKQFVSEPYPSIQCQQNGVALNVPVNDPLRVKIGQGLQH